MKNKIIIAGGSGFIGNYLADRFVQEGFQVLIISRGSKYISWENELALIESLEGALALINLAGKSVDCRYNEKNKNEILNSRIDTTKKLQQAIDQCETPPEVWINSSTATIYRYAEDRPMDEITGEIGTGFSVNVAEAWEQAFFEKATGGTRKVALRIAITLGPGGGVMTPYVNLVKFGLGGKQGNGKQIFSWIHVEDLFRLIKFTLQNENIEGIYNASAPHPVTNSEFMKTLRQILKPLFFLPSPKLLLKAGAFLIKTETELVLKSRWVIPYKITEAGFTFDYPEIREALEDILNK